MRTYCFKIISILSLSAQFIQPFYLFFESNEEIEKKFEMKGKDYYYDCKDISTLRKKIILVLEEFTNGSGYRHIRWNADKCDYEVDK